MRGEAEPTDGLHKFDILLGTNTAVVVSVTAGECLSSMLSRETLWGVRGVVRNVTLVTIEYSIKPKCQLLYTHTYVLTNFKRYKSMKYMIAARINSISYSTYHAILLALR